MLNSREINPNNLETSMFILTTINKDLPGKKIMESWFNLQGFLDYCGFNLQEWLKLPVNQQLFDLLHYTSYQNIIGSLIGLTTQEILETLEGNHYKQN